MVGVMGYFVPNGDATGVWGWTMMCRSRKKIFWGILDFIHDDVILGVCFEYSFTFGTRLNSPSPSFHSSPTAHRNICCCTWSKRCENSWFLRRSSRDCCLSLLNQQFHPHARRRMMKDMCSSDGVTPWYRMPKV